MDIRTVIRFACRPVMMAALVAASGPLLAPSAAHAAEAAAVEGVTAAAWAVADAETGEVLASHELERPSNIASVTKLMTLLVVTEMAAARPAILDEELSFAERAVAIGGTKTGLAAGERISVREALYGLMLPSGNDAGYMLAIHFGAPMVAAGVEATPASAYKAFVAAMNRKARALGMTQTRYSSAFGDALDPDRRTSSARDQLILARAAMANPLVRQVVGTREHETIARTASGAERRVAWHNTNELLGRPGVTGIKTGSNRSAHSCLLTEVSVDGRRYHVAVLGSRTSADRYNDTLKVLKSVTGRTVK